MEFSLLWTYFEATHVQANASGRSIVALAKKMDASGSIDADRLLPLMAYFCARYVHAGEFTHHFDGLHLRNGDNPELVANVLLGKANSPYELLVCALTIVYRYRNNLFHGLKWAYGIRDQRKNFEVASALLIAVMEMHTGR